MKSGGEPPEADAAMPPAQQVTAAKRVDAQTVDVEAKTKS